MKRFTHPFIIAALALGAATTACNNKEEEGYHTVTLDANGGQIVGPTTKVVKTGETVDMHVQVIAPEDHRFIGWYLEPEQINGWGIYVDAVTRDMTLYAGWKRLYTVTFHANGGAFHDNNQSETWKYNVEGVGGKLRLPENEFKPGYVLEGWYRDEQLTRRWDFENDVVEGDCDLWAKWGPGIEGLTRENYPLVDGATSTRALNMMIACKLLGMPYGWFMVSTETGEVTVWPRYDNGFADKSLDGWKIKTSQTYGAMMNLIGGQADIILRSTTASEVEQETAAAAGVTLVETPVALDAFVFLKHPANSVKSLTLEQIRKIYTGQITNWSQVGGDNAEMKVFTRPRNSGSEEALRELVMEGLTPAEFPEEQQAWSMAGLFWEMEREKYGIGYIFKNYKERIMIRHEPVFALGGVSPDAATMKNGTYPLTTKVYAIIRSDLDRTSMAWRLYEWLQTEAAKMVLTECGFTTAD